MRTLFEELRRDGFVVIRRLLDERQQEGVSLDFKEKADPRDGRLSRDDRQALAENLSAFANSAGGLLIFGIEARKDSEGVDAASNAKPISQLARFQSEVTHAVGDLLLPRHDGIEVVAVADPAGKDTGYLAVWVDRSERRPHQSQAAKDRRYYKRAGDSSFVMEHYDVEDAFRRQTTPELSLTLRMGGISRKQGGGFGVFKGYRFVFSLYNASLVTARFPYVHFMTLNGLYIPRYGTPPLRQRRQEGRLCFDGGADDVIHPDQSLDAGVLELGVITRGLTKELADLSSGQVPEQMTTEPLATAAMRFECGFGAENCRMRKEERSFSAEQILTLIGDQ